MEKDVKTFGDRVRDLRIAKGWTLEDLAKRVGVRHSAIGNWENYDVKPHASTMAKLVAVLDTTVSYLLHGEIAEPEGPSELREAVEHWRTRALTAERERDAIRNVVRTVASDLAEAASASYDERKRRERSERISDGSAAGQKQEMSKELDQLGLRGRERGQSKPPSESPKGQ